MPLWGLSRDGDDDVCFLPWLKPERHPEASAELPDAGTHRAHVGVYQRSDVQAIPHKSTRPACDIVARGVTDVQKLLVANGRGDGLVMSCRTFLRRENERGLYKLLRVSR